MVLVYGESLVFNYHLDSLNLECNSDYYFTLNMLNSVLFMFVLLFSSKVFTVLSTVYIKKII